MYVRCTHCGYDNSPEYRFCGMCGASLAQPPPAPEPAAKEIPRPTTAPTTTTENVHGPSFLGLADDPKVEFHYLYEDEEQRSHVGLVVFLLIIVGAAGFLGWQWRHNGFPFNRLSASTTTGGQPSASPSEVAPAMNQSQETHIEKPMTGVGDAASKPPEEKAQPDTAAKSNATAPAGENPAGASSATENQTKASDQTPAEEKAASDETEQAKATPPARPRQRASEVKPASSRERALNPAAAADASAKTSPDADLELLGEKYLYGSGVPQNCTRAESSLRTAATHGNSKAETVLGTMYATGHCVGRDLPTAYRWFARALQKEPQNARISADLQVLWHQMTPQEQQLATSSR